MIGNGACAAVAGGVDDTGAEAGYGTTATVAGGGVISGPAELTGWGGATTEGKGGATKTAAGQCTSTGTRSGGGANGKDDGGVATERSAGGGGASARPGAVVAVYEIWILAMRLYSSSDAVISTDIDGVSVKRVPHIHGLRGGGVPRVIGCGVEASTLNASRVQRYGLRGAGYGVDDLGNPYTA